MEIIQKILDCIGFVKVVESLGLNPKFLEKYPFVLYFIILFQCLIYYCYR